VNFFNRFYKVAIFAAAVAGIVFQAISPAFGWFLSSGDFIPEPSGLPISPFTQALLPDGSDGQWGDFEFALAYPLSIVVALGSEGSVVVSAIDSGKLEDPKFEAQPTFVRFLIPSDVGGQIAYTGDNGGGYLRKVIKGDEVSYVYPGELIDRDVFTVLGVDPDHLAANETLVADDSLARSSWGVVITDGEVLAAEGSGVVVEDIVIPDPDVDGEEPGDSGEAPVGGGETPIGGDDTPGDSSGTPVDSGEEPGGGGEGSVDGGETPVVGAEEPGDEDQVPGDETSGDDEALGDVDGGSDDPVESLPNEPLGSDSDGSSDSASGDSASSDGGASSSDDSE
jgi:hypothetical protein